MAWHLQHDVPMLRPNQSSFPSAVSWASCTHQDPRAQQMNGHYASLLRFLLGLWSIRQLKSICLELELSTLTRGSRIRSLTVFACRGLFVALSAARELHLPLVCRLQTICCWLFGGLWILAVPTIWCFGQPVCWDTLAFFVRLSSQYLTSQHFLLLFT